MQTNLSFLKLFLFFILISNLSLAQLHPPGVEWQKEYAPTIDPFSTFELEEDNTGEDWWYDHKNSYSSGNQDGYICAGYANIVNEEIIEPSSGCSVSSLGAVQTCKEDYPNIYSIYKTLTNNFPTNPFTGSASLAIMSKMDLNGNPIWVRTFDQGQFFKVIQSADGGYVAVGQTQSSLNVSDLINPILYNPTTSNPSGEITTCNIPCSFLSNPVTEPKAQLYVVKVDATGKLIWKYRYGYYNTTDPLFCATSNAGFDLVELGASPNFFYRIVGKSETREINSFGNGGNFWNTNGYILDINYNGLKLADEIVETTNFSPSLFSFNNFNAIKKSTYLGQEVVAITGTYGLVDWVGPQFWNRDIPVLYYPSGSVSPGATSAYGSIGFLGFNFLYSGNPNNAYDLTFDAKGNILIPAIVNCISGGCYGAGNNIATGEIVRYSPFSQSILNTYSLGVGHSTIHAFDLKMGITSTSDGGFAIVTTEVTNNYVQTWLGGINGSYSCGTNTFDIRTDSYWNSDAYVAKYDINGILEWDKTIDEDPDNPPANYKTDFPEDYKKQECVYSISQATDGGYVVAGNYSDNLDDCYLFKLYSDCDSRLLADLITNNDPTFYNANTTPFTTSIWSTPTKVFGNLVIPAGESLTIRNTTVNFFDSKSLGDVTDIVVEPGGSLFVDNSTLDVINRCGGKMWDGIQVLGDPSISQSVTTQGLATIDNNSVITNARIGIMASSASRTHYNIINPDNLNGGGIIRIQGGSTFLNNRRSVFFGIYPFPVTSTSSNQNLSRIVNSNFICDNVLQDPNYYFYDATNVVTTRVGSSQIISAFLCNSIPVASTTIRTIGAALSIPVNHRPSGIVSVDAPFSINGTKFIDLYQGVNSHFTTNTMHDRINVYGSYFSGIPYNVYTLGGAFHSVSNSEFNIPDYSSNLGINKCFGVWNDHGDADYIGFNKFFGSSPVSINSKIGEVITNSDLGGGFVEHNTFKDLEIGSQTELDNPNLLIKCNDYTNHTNAWAVNPQNMGVLADQGTGSSPFLDTRAGNNFYDPICLPHGITTKHILDPFLEFAYWTTGNGFGSNPDPTCIDALLKNGNSQDVIYCLINPSNETSCILENPCPDPPNCYQRMAQINKYLDPEENLNYANKLIRYFLNTLDTLSGDSLAENYLSQRSVTDTFALACLSNNLNRPKVLLKTKITDAPANRVYLDVNNTANTRRVPYTYIPMPNQIEQISRSTKRTSSIQAENKKLDLVLIPNPSSGIFKIQINGEYEANKVYQLKIIDCLGKTIESKRIVLSNNLQLDLSDVSNGIYLLIIFDNDINISNSRISILK